MVILDTNIVSELMRDEPTPRVVRWVDGSRPDELFLTAITTAEIKTGLAIMAAVDKRTRLQAAFDAFITRGFRGRTLPFDEACSDYYASIVAHRREIGRPIAQLDAQIASIALVHNQSVATRNTRDFEECGIDVVNPFGE